MMATTTEQTGGEAQKRVFKEEGTSKARKQAKLTGFVKMPKDTKVIVGELTADTAFDIESITLETLLLLAGAHQSWMTKLVTEFEEPYTKTLETFLRAELGSQTIHPPTHQIFSWAALCPFDGIHVVILGQDPYHGPGQAHGLAFSVAKGVRPPPSLRNIYKELEADLPAFSRPSHGLLEAWAKQGVLLLNTSLTVRSGKPASHSGRGWEQLTEAIVKAISRDLENVVFLLWGAHAQTRAPLIDGSRHLVLQSAHPSPLSASRGFLGCRHFSTANKYLEDNGKSPIDWSL